VAPDLLGSTLVRVLDGQRISGRIVEVEAYVGPEDTACHASRGRTARNEVMFGEAGHAYVYFTYGMHWMLNVVTERVGYPAAVLIRALEPLEGIDVMRRLRGSVADRDLARGPARLCQALAIDRAWNGTDLVRGDGLFIEGGIRLGEDDVVASPRIGIDYSADCDREAPWRFTVKGSPHVSRPPARAAQKERRLSSMRRRTSERSMPSGSKPMGPRPPL
jgi:DNA-3-methyladenine glycosylase